MRSNFAGLFLGVFGATAAYANETQPVFFHLESMGGDFNFEKNAWVSAIEGSGGEEKVMFLHKAGTDAFAEAVKEAKELGVTAPVIPLTTANIPGKNSVEFQRKSAKLLKDVREKAPNRADWEIHMDVPMCTLFSRANDKAYVDTDKVYLLSVLDNAQARSICYQMTIGYFAQVPKEDGTRVAPVFVDSQAVVWQAMMNPLELHSAYLAVKESRDDRGRYAERETNVYAPGEEIFIKAYFSNVSRDLVGTDMMSYAIRMDLEVRDMEGNVLGRQDNVHTYENPSKQIFPIDETQFWNHVTAGISLPDSGAYKVAFIFTDLNRPETQSGPAEAVFDIIVR